MNIIGNISLDTVIYHLGTKTRKLQFWGGAGLNISISMSRAGLKPRLITTCGTDFASLLTNLTNQVDIEYVNIGNEPSCTFEMHYDGSGRLINIFSEFGISEKINQYLQEINPFPEDHTHICYRTPLEATIVDRLISLGRPISIDFISSSMNHKIEEIAQYLPHVQWLFVNGQEFETLQEKLPIDNLQHIINTSSNNTVKYYYKGTLVHKVAYEESDFLDVTGAGDTFIGNFLFGLQQRADTLANLNYAIEAARKSLQGPGVWTPNEKKFVRSS